VYVTKQLIEARCNVHIQNKDGRTPLYIAAQEGHASVTKQLIEAPCNINLQQQEGAKPSTAMCAVMVIR
jgi:ankyrin repeat protein